MSQETQTPQETLKKSKKVKMVWTLERCSKVAGRYTSENEWKAGAPSSYKSAVAKGWLNECLGKLQSNGSKAKKPGKSA